MNLAARMESEGTAGTIQIAEGTRRLLGPRYRTVPPAPVEAKGLGMVQCHLLLQRDDGTGA